MTHGTALKHDITAKKQASVWVFGHRNPDNDSICSAVAYAWLKNAVDPSRHYQAVRLGPLPFETAWIFERYGVEVPPVVQHVYSHVSDAMTSGVIAIKDSSTLLEAGQTMRRHNIRALVVNGQDGRYKGLFSTRMLAEIFIADLEDERPRSEALARTVGDYLDGGALVLPPDALLRTARADILDSALREAVVLDENGFCVGIITRTDLARTPKPQVILVDHNETAQSALGVTEAEVLEVVDHHRIGDIQTSSPIRFINLPLGATASIVALEYQRAGVEVPPAMAALMLAAIMTDTVVLKSPTTTPSDVELAAWLAGLLGVDAVTFGLELFASRENAQAPTLADVVGADAKEFELGDGRILIAQYETVKLADMLLQSSELLQALEERAGKGSYQFALLLLTDIVAEGSEIYAVGDTRLVERSLQLTLKDGHVWAPGILSRKKQVAARILAGG